MGNLLSNPDEKHREKDDYIVYINDPLRNKKLKYPENSIKTSKYTLLTFLPLNLFSQFQKIYNLYFLVVVVAMFVPGVTPLDPVVNIFPLLIVLVIVALKDGIEDIKRYRADRAANDAPYKVLASSTVIKAKKHEVVPPDELIVTKSRNIRTGDILLIENNQPLPADIVLLSSSDEHGVCYVETGNLDGESNLKQFQAMPITNALLRRPSELMACRGFVRCEHPSESLYSFCGLLSIQIPQQSLNQSPNAQPSVVLKSSVPVQSLQTTTSEAPPSTVTERQLLVRGMRLRNTKWVYGIVVYTGKNTKLSMNNQRKPHVKYGHVDKRMSFYIIWIFILQISVCVIAGILSGVFQGMYAYSMWYLGYGSPPLDSPSSGASFALLSMITFFVLLSRMLPTALIVTAELVRVAATAFMQADKLMSHKDANGVQKGMKVKSSNLHDELGQIQYVFSDKTGTLTENKMVFCSCCVGGKVIEEESAEGRGSLRRSLFGTRRLSSYERDIVTTKPLDAQSAHGSPEYVSPGPLEYEYDHQGQDFGGQEVLNHHDSLTIQDPPGGQEHRSQGAYHAHENLLPTGSGDARDQAALFSSAGSGERDITPPGSPTRSHADHETASPAKPPSMSMSRKTAATWQDEDSRDVTAPSFPNGRPTATTWRHEDEGGFTAELVLEGGQVAPAPLDLRANTSPPLSPTTSPPPAPGSHVSSHPPSELVSEFLLMMAICNSVVPEWTKDRPPSGPGSDPDSDPESDPNKARGPAGPGPHAHDHPRALPVQSHVFVSDVPDLETEVLPSGASSFSTQQSPHAQPMTLDQSPNSVVSTSGVSLFPRSPGKPDESPLTFLTQETSPVAGHSTQTRDVVLHSAFQSGRAPVTVTSRAMVSHPRTSAQFLRSTHMHISYVGTSPDEVALVKSARNNGVILCSRSATSVIVNVQGEDQQYEILALIKFTSDRKRMSVIVRRPDGKIKLYCKGSDDEVFNKRLRLDLEDPVRIATQDALNLFSQEGLRTLVFASRELSDAEFDNWIVEYREAETHSDRAKRERLWGEKCNEVEKDLDLVGVSAVEDKLQAGVPETIKYLLHAGIVAWVLTGDMQETAINIAFSSSLLAPDMELIKVNVASPDALKERLQEVRHILHACGVAPSTYSSPSEPRLVQLKRLLTQLLRRETSPGVHVSTEQLSALPSITAPYPLGGPMGMQGFPHVTSTMSPNDDADDVVVTSTMTAAAQDGVTQSAGTTKLKRCALVIDGRSLSIALESEECVDMFLEISSRCCSVICCRVTPIQKATLVKLVKKKMQKICLAIGDGANDVGMIQEAHVGIGVMGNEGTQASLAADYVIYQFRHLERLLAVHGRYNYIREAFLIHSIFYKDVAFTLPQLWYSIYTGWTGTPLFGDWVITGFDVIFTSLPSIIVGLFEKDLNEDVIHDHPEAYLKLRTDDMTFTWKTLGAWYLAAVWHSVVAFFFIYAAVSGGGEVTSIGQSYARLEVGTLCSTACMLIILLKISIHTNHWIFLNWVIYIGSFVVYVAWLFVDSSDIAFTPDMMGVITNLSLQPTTYVLVVLVTLVALLPDTVFRFVQRNWYPLYWNDLQIFTRKSRHRVGSATSTVALAQPKPVGTADGTAQD